MFNFVCQQCSISFERSSRVASNGKPFQFCSLVCSGMSRVKKDEYKCPECSLVFTYKTPRVYCSRKCYHGAKRKQGTKEKVCQQCGSEFNVLGKSRAENRTFCSKACTSRSRMTSKLEKLGGISAIKRQIVEKAKKQGFWLGSNQARAMFKVRHEFFDEFGISLDDINRSLGLRKPKSGFEELVYSALQSAYPEATIEREVSGPASRKGYPTRFDFVLNGRIAIEADGPQHTNEANNWHSKEYVERDKLKEDYCREAGMPMIRVRHSNAWTEARLIKAIKAELSAINHNVASNGGREGLKIIAWGQSASKPSGKPAEGSTTNAHCPNG